jgi:hypothetical protein
MPFSCPCAPPVPRYLQTTSRFCEAIPSFYTPPDFLAAPSTRHKFGSIPSLEVERQPLSARFPCIAQDDNWSAPNEWSNSNVSLAAVSARAGAWPSERFEGAQTATPGGDEHFWRPRLVACGKPLVSHQLIVQFIAATTTKTGLKVRCQLDETTYPAGIRVSDAEMDAVNLTRHDFHGEWNYTISPKALALER